MLSHVHLVACRKQQSIRAFASPVGLPAFGNLPMAQTSSLSPPDQTTAAPEPKATPQYDAESLWPSAWPKAGKNASRPAAKVASLGALSSSRVAARPAGRSVASAAAGPGVPVTQRRKPGKLAELKQQHAAAVEQVDRHTAPGQRPLIKHTT